MYTLEKYTGIQSRYTCPSCGVDRQFTKYINTETGEYLAEYVGYCNRITNCDYHYTPRQYFLDNPTEKASNTFAQAKIKPEVKKEPTFIPTEIYARSLRSEALFKNNNLVQFLVLRFGIPKTKELVYRFKIGTSTHWPGATVFWQIDQNDKVRTGKVMLYNAETGKRVKKPHNHITWVHSILHKESRVDSFCLQQCLFGLPQVYTNENKPIGIVESEKTAIIASVYLPELIWLATGSIQNLNAQMLFPIQNKQIILFPDLNGYTLWRNKADKVKKELEINISISDLLEKRSSLSDKEHGFDLADYLLK